MKKRGIYAIAALLCLLLAGCSTKTAEQQVSQASQLLEKEPEKAVVLLEKALHQESDEDVDWKNQAWQDLIKGYLLEEKYQKANDTISNYMYAINQDDTMVSMESLKENLEDYSQELTNQQVILGYWYYELNPSAVSLDDLYSWYYTDESIYISVPRNMQVWYTLDGSDPTGDTGILYDEDTGISMEAYQDQDVFTLKVASENRFGDFSDISEKEISISDYDSYYDDNEDTSDYSDIDDYDYDYDYDYDSMTDDSLELPLVDIAAGDYDTSQTIYITNYSLGYEDSYSAYYTVDGGDPRDYDSLVYDEDLGITLDDGQYTLQLVIYDWNSGNYSNIASYTYNIGN